MGDNLHVAVICRELGGQGSVPAVAVRQALELARHVRVTLISDSFPDNTGSCLRRHRVRAADLSFLRRFSHVPRELAFAFAVKRSLYRLQEQGAGLNFVHCHAHSLVAIASCAFRQRFNVPCGLVAHGNVFSSPPGTYDWRMTRFFQWAIPRGYAQADLIVALSPIMRERAIACGADPRKVEVVPNGIEPGEIGLNWPRSPESGSTLSSTPARDCLKALFVGTLNQRKGIDVLLRAAKRLNEEDMPFCISVIGDGPLRLESDRMIAANGLSNKVAFYGSISRAELGKWYQWADVTCVPSSDDPLPTVVLESLLAGTPVVGSAVGGIPFMIQPEANGLLVPPSDPDGLAAALGRIIRQPALLWQLKQGSAASVFPRFSWERNGEDLLRAIAKAVNYPKP